jgi:hypothetical protein
VALTPDQQKTVEDALFADDPAATLAAIGGMSPQQLHAFICEYNWDDGLAIPRAILKHDACERGTALHIYYALGGPFAEPAAKANHRALLEEAKSRLLSGSLPERHIAYDPVVEWEINKLQLAKLLRAGLQEELIRPSRPR